MSTLRAPSLFLALIAATPALAASGITIEEARVEAGKPGAGAALVVRTRQASAEDVTWVTGTVRAGGTGKPADVRFEPAATRQTGTGALAKRITGKAAASLTLLSADGKTLGTYTGSLDASGRLRLSDDSPRALAPAIEGFIAAAADGGSTAVVSVVDATAASGVLVVGATKTTLAFGDVEVAWTAELPATATALWSVDLAAEIATSPGKSDRTVWRRDDLFKADLAAPWSNGGVGVPALAFGDGGQTSFALLPPAAEGCGWGETCAEPGAHALVGFSDGWTEGAEQPVALELAIADGGSLRLPLNSAQRVGVAPLSFGTDPTGRAIEVVADGEVLRVTAGGGATCGVGTCFAVAVDDGRWGLVATVYGTDAATLPDAVKVGFSAGTEKAPALLPKESTVTVTVSSEIALVFALAVLPAQDAWSAPVVFTPSLLGAKEGGTLVFGEPSASRVATGGASYALGARTRTGPPTSDAAVWSGGEPIGVEQVGEDGVPVPVGPPIVLDANCAGTRSAIPSTRNKPGLR